MALFNVNDSKPSENQPNNINEHKDHSYTDIDVSIALFIEEVVYIHCAIIVGGAFLINEYE